MVDFVEGLVRSIAHKLIVLSLEVACLTILYTLYIAYSWLLSWSQTGYQ